MPHPSAPRLNVNQFRFAHAFTMHLNTRCSAITTDGRRINSKEKALAWLAEIEAEGAAGKTAADTLV